MTKIKNVKGRQVFDSRGNPTVEAEVFLDNGISAFAISPSGASTGAFEAHELRDQDNSKFLGKSVYSAIDNINKLLNIQYLLPLYKTFNENALKLNLGNIDQILDSTSHFSSFILTRCSSSRLSSSKPSLIAFSCASRKCSRFRRLPSQS